MLAECLQHIPFCPAGVYLDCTFGGGGHSQGILARMDQDSRLYAIDADDAAVARGRDLAAGDARLMIERANFSQSAELCRRWGAAGKLGAALADLGVSSPQLDDGARGFSFRHDAPLDMRMDRRQSPDAAEWINACPVEELRRVLADLGQLRRPGRLATAIDRYRRKTRITHTGQLADLIAAIEPAGGTRHPATSAFRAIRMHINRELESLAALFEAMGASLARGGRLLIICFHSLEVRLVKSRLESPTPRKLPLKEAAASGWRLLAKATPQPQEIAANPRARSASLFVLERR